MWGLFSRFWQQKGASILGAFHDLTYNGDNDKRQNFKSLSDDGYSKCGAVYLAIKQISQNFAEIPWVVRDRTKKEFPIVENWENQSLLITPNERTSAYKFREAVIGYYMIGGNSFIYPITNTSGKRLIWLYPIMPSSIEIVGNKKNAHEVLYYKMGHEPNVKEVDPLTMFHAMQFNPTNYIEGMSPLRAVLMDIDLNNSGKKWNVALQQNMGKPSGMVSAKNTLNDSQYNRLKDQVRKKWQGASNVGNVWIGDGDLKWEKTSLSPTDADWIEGLKLSKVEIVTALGVPPELCGIGEQKTYSNVAEARRAFYQETVIPLAKMFTCEFTTWLHMNRWLDENLFIGLDLKDVAGLAEDETQLYERVGKADWLTVNEKRLRTGYKDEPKKPEWNMTKFELELIKANKAEKESDTQDNDEEVDDKDEKSEKGLYRYDHLTIVNVKNETDEEMIFKTIDRKREELIAEYQKALEAMLAREHKTVMAFVDKATAEFMIYTLAVKAVDEGYVDWKLILGSGDKAIAETFAKETIKDIALSLQNVNVGMFNAEAVAKEIDRTVESQIGQLVKGINDTSKKDIGKIVSTGIEKGQDMKQIAKEIDKLYLEEYIPKRSMTIARTETIKSSNMGSFLGANASPVKLDKVWLSTKDSRTRSAPESNFDHVHPNNQVRDMDAPFDVSNEKLMYPCDSSLGAKAGNVINCRCTMFYKPKRKAKK